MKILYVMVSISVIGLQATYTPSPYDLTIVGQVSFADGLGRLPIGLIDCLNYDLYINHVPTPGHYSCTDVSEEVRTVLTDPYAVPGNVALLFDILWAHEVVPSRFMPKESFIKIAYSMLESSEIPRQWVNILNEQFDAVVVPDPYYKEVYLRSGVHIPLFVLPHGIYIDELLAQTSKKKKATPFVFGCSAAYWPRKNHEVLIEAFSEEFGNDPQVILKLHGRTGSKSYVTKLTKQITDRGIKNIELIKKKLSKQGYENFFRSLDCYVLVSKGEGYSVTPREALALGIPCILSNNSAHKTIGASGCVYSVSSEISEPAYYSHLGMSGDYYNCSVKDVRKALREVYTHYSTYLNKAHKGRKWVERYTWKSLKKKFLNLIKPKKVKLGKDNVITDEYLMTSSQQLYDKYIQLIEKPYCHTL